MLWPREWKSAGQNREGKRRRRDEIQGLLEQEIQQYESYVNADGERRQEIESLEPWSKQMLVELKQLIEESFEVEEIIDEWEDDEEEGGEGPDLDALWSPLEHRLGSLSIHKLSFVHGVKDKKKEGWLEQVSSMYQEGFLELVVPEGREVLIGLLDWKMCHHTRIWSRMQLEQ